jgi:hypothetical protein
MFGFHYNSTSSFHVAIANPTDAALPLRSQDRVAAAELTQQGIEALDSPRSSGSLGQWQDRLLSMPSSSTRLYDTDTSI